MEKYKIKINSNPYEVNILSVKSPKAEVEVNGLKYEVDISDIPELSKTTATNVAKAVSAPVAATAKAPGGAGSDIVAPLPGKIIKINVSEGNSVNAGDILMIMEAMKMENQIKSTAAGTVTKIHVKQGDNVAERALLVTIS